MGPRPGARTRGGLAGEATGVGGIGASDGCEAMELAWESSRRLTGEADGARGSKEFERGFDGGSRKEVMILRE